MTLQVSSCIIRLGHIPAILNDITDCNNNNSDNNENTNTDDDDLSSATLLSEPNTRRLPPGMLQANLPQSCFQRSVLQRVSWSHA